MSHQGMAARVVVGTDLVEIRQVAESIARFGDRYLKRVFTAHELATCGEGADRASRLAARFAAKEATLKVLRPVDHGIDWRTIEVHREEGGHCEMILRGAACDLARAAKINSLSVSLSHEAAYAIAVVVGERVSIEC